MENNCCSKKEDSKNISTLAEYLKIVSDENRLKILCLLKEGERCVCDIHEPLSLSQNLISHHLKVLKEFNLVTSSKRGKWVYYKLNENIINKLNKTYFELFKPSAKSKNTVQKKNC